MNKNAITTAVVAVVAIAAVAAFLLLGNGDKNYNGGNGDKPVMDGKSSWSKSQCPYADTNADEKVASDDVSLEKRFLNGERTSMSYNNSYHEAMRAEYDAMELVRMEDLGNKRFNELSAVHHQKVAIVRGIVQRPRVLLLDDLTANLDVRYQVYVTDILRALAETEETIVVMISHDLNISAKYAHSIIMMGEPGRSSRWALLPRCSRRRTSRRCTGPDATSSATRGPERES